MRGKDDQPGGSCRPLAGHGTVLPWPAAATIVGKSDGRMVNASIGLLDHL